MKERDTIPGMPAIDYNASQELVTDLHEVDHIATELLGALIYDGDLYTQILADFRENYLNELLNKSPKAIEDKVKECIKNIYIKNGYAILAHSTKGIVISLINSQKYQIISNAIIEFAESIASNVGERIHITLREFVENAITEANFKYTEVDIPIQADEAPEFLNHLIIEPIVDEPTVIPMRPMQPMDPEEDEGIVLMVQKSPASGIRLLIAAAVLAITLRPSVTQDFTEITEIVEEATESELAPPDVESQPEPISQPTIQPLPPTVTMVTTKPDAEPMEANPVLTDVDISTLEQVSQVPGALIADTNNLTDLSVKNLESQPLQVITVRDSLKTYDANGNRVSPNLPRSATVVATGNAVNFDFIDPRTGQMTEATFVEVSYNGTNTYAFAGYFAVQENVQETFLDSIFKSEDTQPVIEVKDKMQNTRLRKMFNNPQKVTYTTESGIASTYELIGTETVRNKKSVEFEYLILKNPQTGLQIRVNKNTIINSPNRLVEGSFVEDAVEIEDIELIPVSIHENVTAVTG